MNKFVAAAAVIRPPRMVPYEGDNPPPPPAAPEFLKDAPDGAMQVIREGGFDKATDLNDFLGKFTSSYSELKGKSGKEPAYPGPDVDDEGWKNFTDKIRPKDLSAYKFSLPAEVPENFPYDSDFAKSFQQFAHEKGIHPRHAAELHDWFVQNSVGVFTKTNDDMAADAAAAHGELVKTWGAPDSATYKENLSHLKGAIKHLGGDALTQEMIKFGLVTPTGDVRAPNIAKALAAVGGALYKEDDLLPNENKEIPRGNNPFKKGQENATKQSQIIKQDVNLARRLMREAGVDPKEYQL